VLTDGKGVPLATIVSEANRTDMKRLEELLDARLIALPPLPEDTPDEERPQLCLDRGYDYDACRATARAHGYVPHIPPKSSAAQPLPPPGHPDRHPPRRSRRGGGALLVQPLPPLAHPLSRRRARTTWPWSNSLPSSLSIASCAMPTCFADRL